MALEGFNVMSWFAFALLLGLYSPCYGNTTLVFGVGNGGRDTVSLVKPCMYAMALLIWIEIFCGEVGGCKHQSIHVSFDGPIDDPVDASISCRPDILEGNGLIEGASQFILGSLL